MILKIGFQCPLCGRRVLTTLNTASLPEVLDLCCLDCLSRESKSTIIWSLQIRGYQPIPYAGP